MATFDVTDFGAVGNGSTDDTSAIQDAIDAAETAGGGTVYFPIGAYVVNGALQDTSRSNAQLLLPIRDYPDVACMTIELQGEVPPSSVASVIGATPLPDNLSVIKGTLNVGTDAQLLGAHGPVGTFEDFTNVRVVMRNLVVEMPANPVLTALDFSCCAQADLDDVLVHAGNFDIASIAAQTTATSYGVKLPKNGNGAHTKLGTVNVFGFSNGYQVAEHANGANVNAMGCKVGAEFIETDHASTFDRLMTVHCQTGLKFTGGFHSTFIQQYNIEHAASGTWVTTYDVDDSSNFALGLAYWHTVLAGSGRVATFLVNGAKYLKRAQLSHQGGVFNLTDAATVTVDCSVSDNFRWTIAGNRTFANPTNPYDGQVINVRITQDATGSRTWTLGSKLKFPGGAPTLSTAANAVDLISCQWEASADTWTCAISKGMA